MPRAKSARSANHRGHNDLTALEREGCRAVIIKGRQYRGYVNVDADALKAQRDLDYRIGRSLEYNARITLC